MFLCHSFTIFFYRSGSIKILNESLYAHEGFFIQTGVYLILEKLRAITYRTLFKRVGLLLETHQIPLQAFLEALKAQGVSIFVLIFIVIH